MLSIFFLESISSKNDDRVESLSNALCKICAGAINISYSKCDTKSDFFKKIEEYLKKCSQEPYAPLIHISGHGSKDFIEMGLKYNSISQATNEERKQWLIRWEEFAVFLMKMIGKYNLEDRPPALCFDNCHAFSGIKMFFQNLDVKIRESKYTPPFLVLIGSEKPTRTDENDSFYVSFYASLLYDIAYDKFDNSSRLFEKALLVAIEESEKIRFNISCVQPEIIKTMGGLSSGYSAFTWDALRAVLNEYSENLTN